jgi:hypothetical protein
VPFWLLDPDLGSGIDFFWIPDLGFQTRYFWELSDKYLGEKLYNSLKSGPNFFSSAFQK